MFNTYNITFNVIRHKLHCATQKLLVLVNSPQSLRYSVAGAIVNKCKARPVLMAIEVITQNIYNSLQAIIMEAK